MTFNTPKPILGHVSMDGKKIKNTYTIEEVADLADVNAFTLRNWEDRYHLFAPSRDLNGRRIFSELEAMRAICASELVKRNYKIGKLAPLLLEAQDPVHVVNQFLESGYFLELRQNALEGLLKFEPNPARVAFDHLIANYSIEFLADHFFYPLFRQIERLCVENSITDFQEKYSHHHLASRLHRLIGLVELNVRKKANKKILICGLPGNRYEDSFLILYLALERDGWTVFYGAREFKTEDLEITIAATGAQVLIAAGNNITIEQYLATAPMLENLSVPVVIGGRVAANLRASGLTPSPNLEWSTLYPGPLARMMSYKLL